MMHKVLFVLPDFHASDLVRQVSRLALALVGRDCDVRLCAFRDGVEADRFLARGITADVLGRGWSCDPRPFVRLRETLQRWAPDVVHAWGLSNQSLALRFLRWHGCRRLLATVDRIDGAPTRTWLTWPQKSGGVQWVLPCASLASLWRRAGQEALVIPAPGAAVAARPQDVAKLRRQMGFPADARLILCAGQFAQTDTWRDALWACDILRFAEPGIQLLFPSEVADRGPLEAFARAAELDCCVRILDRGFDASDYVSLADMLWVPSLVDAPPLMLLDAMAAGRPVVAAEQSSLAEVITHGTTGMFFRAGDKTGLARMSREVLRRPDLAQQLAANARQRVQERHDPEQWVERHLALYEAAQSLPLAA